MTVTAGTIEYALTQLAPPPDPYLRDPVGWARDKLGAHLWSKQAAIPTAVAEHKRTAVQACHGPGKSYVAGVLAAWWIDTHPVGEAIVVTTAPTYKQVNAILWQEIRKQHRKANLPGTILGTDEWKIGDLVVGMGRKPADHDEHAFQGIHRRYVLVILDEACGIPQQLWTAAEAITTNDDCRILAIGNPDDANTEFGRVCKAGAAGGWHVQSIATTDTPNYTGEWVPDELRHLLPSAEWAGDMERAWGKDSPRYMSKVLGQFPESSTDTLIPQAWITAAQDRDIDPPAGTPTTLGVDVARYGTDETITAACTGGRVRVVDVQQGNATTETTTRTITHARVHDAAQARVDGVGVGAGVVDQLALYAAAGYVGSTTILDMQAGAGSTDPLYLNARAQWYWGLRKMFEDGQIDIDPDDDLTASQLASLKYRIDGKGRILIESKDDMKKRGLPSPDRADAVMLATATAALPPPTTVVTADQLTDTITDTEYLPDWATEEAW